MWTIKTITLTHEILKKGEAYIGYYSQYGNLLTFSITLGNSEKITVDLARNYFKIIENKIIFDTDNFPIKLIAGDQLSINLIADINLFLKIYSIPLNEVVQYLISPDSKERLLTQFRLRKSKEETLFWQTTLSTLDLSLDEN